MTRKPGRPAAGLLRREQIVVAALDIADTQGIDAVTMRAVARQLGVEAMSLYHHVANKDDLFDAVVDAVFEQIQPPTGSGPWRPAMRTYAMGKREVLRRHPWALGLMDSRRTPGPATLGHHDAVLGRLRSSGFSLPMAAHAIAVLDSYVHGFVLQESSLPFQGPEDVPEVAEDISGVMPEGKYPHLEEMIRDHALRPGYTFGAEFDWGLELVLDGVERRLDS